MQSDCLNIFSRAHSTLHKVFRGFHRHFKLLQPVEFDFGRNSQIGLWKIIFVSVQRCSAQNLKSTKAVKVLKSGIKILAPKVWVSKILHTIRLKVQGRRCALPQAWELITVRECLIALFFQIRNDREKKVGEKEATDKPWDNIINYNCTLL